MAANPEIPTAQHEFVDLDGQRYACIRNVDRLEPFFMSIVGDSDAWLFAGSNSPFTAGRVDPDHALFPYENADKLMRHADSSGAMSIFRVARDGSEVAVWEPWRGDTHGRGVTRNLYKHVVGTELRFEEINEALGLRFTWSLGTCKEFGLVRHAVLENIGAGPVRVDYLDGYHMLLPAGLNSILLARMSYLAAGYMRHEVVPDVPLGIYTLNASVEDKPRPYESLRAAVAWSVGHPNPRVVISDRGVAAFRANGSAKVQAEVRGEVGAYLVADGVDLAPGARHEWYSVADTGLDHSRIIALRDRLSAPAKLAEELRDAIAADRDGLRRLIAAADGVQQTADEAASAHHFGNVLFNCMRGGTFRDSYRFPKRDVERYLRAQNVAVHARMSGWLATLPDTLDLEGLRSAAASTGDAQLVRICGAYLPLMYSRRHGDPSRPWNRFTIRLKDEAGDPIYGYEGNWRDIFQNWETLAQSFPDYLDQMISVFLNASTADGYNGYRISRDGGVDWEVIEPSDPWSHIGYWGDHQIIYLLRLLESLERFRPGELAGRLNDRLYTYANVPYRVAGFDATLADPHHTIDADMELSGRLMTAAAERGADAKLLPDAAGDPLLVSLAEKLLVPVLVKLTNFVPDGGTWLNTQRPEWNDANNALAGWGLSMVTTAQARRYLDFCRGLFAGDGTVRLSEPVATLLERLAPIYRGAPLTFDDAARLRFLEAAGRAGEEHRKTVYAGDLAATRAVPASEICAFIDAALAVVDRTIRNNRREDGLYHGYNVLRLRPDGAGITNLYAMLEGQVAVLGSGLLQPAEQLEILAALRSGDLYRPDQKSYLLYPDLELRPFLARNTITAQPPLDDPRVFVRDGHGRWHFQADLRNAYDLAETLDEIGVGEEVRAAVLDLWESVFRHQQFTGRSRTFFMFEGLGSIYWHMVSKLLLTVQECYEAAVRGTAGAGKAGDAAGAGDAHAADALADAYDHVRDGLGFRKSADVQGAFPSDPYSHTPRHRGAQQPGMTGAVKEEILARWGELGVKVGDGRLSFEPALLHAAEFATAPSRFDYTDVLGQDATWDLPAGSLAFTYCATPVRYDLADSAGVAVEWASGKTEQIEGAELPGQAGDAVFARDGSIKRITVRVPRANLRQS